MPTYTNASSVTISVGVPFMELAPGDNVVSKYIKSLPENVTLKSHEPIVSPWTLVDVITSVPMEAEVDVSSYNTIIIYNASNTACTVSANTDDDSAFAILSGTKETFSNVDRRFGCVEILSMGTGTVYIYGVA